MRVIKEVDRGTMVTFVANSFLAANGANVFPSNVHVYVNYVQDGNNVLWSNTMTFDSNTNTWTADWVSVGDFGPVDWTILSEGPAAKAESGSFRVKGNKSTP